MVRGCVIALLIKYHESDKTEKIRIVVHVSGMAETKMYTGYFTGKSE
jgi:hypothetical protein